MKESGLLAYQGEEIPYTVVRSRRRRRTVSLSVKHGQGLRILVPVRITFREITRILSRRAGWIGDQFTTLRQQEPVKPLAEGDSVSFLGEGYRLKIGFDLKFPRGCRIAGDRIEVNAKPEKEQTALIGFYRNEAQSYLQSRIGYWAEVTGIRFSALKLSNARRLWGSCSARNIIRINWRILMAPPAVIDYLLVHELCHIPHKNHGKPFWQRVERHLPDYRQRQKTLRALETDLLARFR